MIIVAKDSGMEFIFDAPTRCKTDPCSNSGADLAALVRESAVASLRARFYTSNGVLNTNADASEIFVEKEHFDMAFTKVSPSVLPHVSTACAPAYMAAKFDFIFLTTFRIRNNTINSVKSSDRLYSFIYDPAFYFYNVLRFTASPSVF